MRYFVISTVGVFLFSGVSIANICVPAREVIDYPNNMSQGRYYRFSPDGNKVIVSGSVDGEGEIGVINITNQNGTKVAVAHASNMANETYPVEGMRRNGVHETALLASPYDDSVGGMGYYIGNENSDRNVFNKGATGAAIFVDKEHDQYYHSTAASSEVNGTTDTFRTMLWSDQRMKDYKILRDNSGEITGIEATSETYNPCTNLSSMEGPIISKDATEVSFSSNEGTVIYRMDPETKKCKKIRSLGYQTSKVNFGYPEHGKRVGFQARRSITSDSGVRNVSGVYTYNYSEGDMDEDDRTSLISGPNEMTRGYPGMLADGRVMYIANIEVEEDGFEELQTKLVIADPSQINPDGTINTRPTTCINRPTASSSQPTGASSASPASSTRE